MDLNEFMERLQAFFPYLKDAIDKQVEFNNGKVLHIVIIEDIYMPEIIKLLEEESDKEKLKKLFDFFEKVSTCDNKVLVENYFSVTVLEILGNDKKILDIAKKYMGPVTTKLQREADLTLGRNVD